MASGLIRNFEGVFGAGHGSFPSPWLDMSTLSMPDQMRNALEWGEYIYDQMGPYRQAMERIIAYLLTEVEIGASDPADNIGEDERKKWDSFLNDTLKIIRVTQEMDRDRMAYGNAFCHFIYPFKRMLYCPNCIKEGRYTSFSFSQFTTAQDFDFQWANMECVGTCPVCKVYSGYRGPWEIDDLPDDMESKMQLVRRNPKEIQIIFDNYGWDAHYVWQVPEDYRKDIRNGDLFQIERCPKALLKAIKHNALYRFSPGSIYHMKEPTLAGRLNRGWGIPRALYTYREIFHVQLLRRQNEGLSADFVVPFRLITPAPRNGSGMDGGSLGDPSLIYNMGDLRGELESMLADHRLDPAGYHFLPFPIQYQTLSGDAKQFVTPELLDNSMESLLNSIGAPIDFYRGTLQMEAAPVSLRLIENHWHHLVRDNNDMLRWVVQQVSRVFSWEAVKATLRRVTYSDDFNKQMALLQLMMGNAISQTTALRALGLEWFDEQRRIAEETRQQAQLQAEVQEEMEQAAFGDQIAKGQLQPGAPAGGAPAAAGGAAAPGGVPPGGGMIVDGNVPQTPSDLMAMAESEAMRIIMLPESQKDSELQMLARKNELLHDLVAQKIKKIRGRAGTAGAAMLLGQQGAAAA